MKNQVYEPHKSSIGGMDANLMALLVYIAPVVISWIPGVGYFAWLIPLVLFFMEKQSDLVKFHAVQSCILYVISALLSFLVSVVFGSIVAASVYSVHSAYAALGMVGLIGTLTMIISLLITIFAIIAMVKAWGYKEYHIPLVGSLSEKLKTSLDKNNRAA